MVRTPGSGGAREVFSFNTADFAAGLQRVVREIEPEATARGLFRGANELLRDAVKIGPQAPKDVGDLWASARTDKATVEAGQAVVQCGFNIVYAAKWHEVPISRKINWTTDKGATNPGPKYLESKLLMYRDKYMVVVANYLRKALESQGQIPSEGGAL